MSALALPPGGGRVIPQGIAIKVDHGQSEDFALFESDLPPGWDGPPPHLHRVYDEAFYVLDGTVAFSLDGVSAEHGVGSFVFVPRGIPHGFANPSDAPARVLVITTPGALSLVENICHLLDGGGAPDPGAMAALYRTHHSEILAPTGSAS